MAARADERRLRSHLRGDPPHSAGARGHLRPPTWLDGPVTLIGANGILGPGPDGETLLHCHAVVVDATGRLHGGHLPPGDVLLGESGAVAMATPLRGAAFAAVYDSETNYPLFQPRRLPAQ